jgi:hypothetical protein
MVRSLAVLAMSAVLVSGIGCVGLANPAGAGGLYLDVKYPVAATSNSGASKTGTAKVMNILGLYTVGDASIETAAKSVGITKIKSVDGHARSIFGLIGWYTVTVTGE